MARARGGSLVARILQRLQQAEFAEIDPHLRDDLRIAWITVLYAWRGSACPDIAATYAVLGLHPDKVWPAIIARRQAQLGDCYEAFYPNENLPPKKPAARVERARPSAIKLAVGERSLGLKSKRRGCLNPAPPQCFESPAMSSSQTAYRKANVGASEKTAEAAREFGTPLRALLYWKKVTRIELSVLHAMLEIGGASGEYLYPSIPRIAAYAKLSERTVQAVIHGEHRQRKSTSTYRVRADRAGLKERHVLRELAKYNATLKKAAIYALQIEALDNDPEIIEKALDKKWAMPPEIVAELSDQQRARIQKKLEFPAEEIEIEKWVNHNVGAWKAFQQELKRAAEARVGTTAKHSVQTAQAHWLAISRRHGVPDRIARAILLRMESP